MQPTLKSVERIPAMVSAGSMPLFLLLSEAFCLYCFAAWLIFFLRSTVTVRPSPVGRTPDPGTNCNQLMVRGVMVSG